MTKCFGAGSTTLEEEKAGIDFLLLYVDVFPETGKIFWNNNAAKQNQGKEAGSIMSKSKPYVRIRHGDRKYFRHRIIFYYCNGYLPLLIDHKHGLEAGDGIENLQESDPLHNMLKRKAKSTPKTVKSKGVDYRASRGKYRAQIKIDGKQKHIGYYDTEEQASIAYEEALYEYQKRIGYV
ncbi:putative homing endonuclease [Enterobacter phage PF-CE2]|uniref:Putative homing endonuclease n=1 Tax=Enterobacter phage PF-CE2 TaxID=2810367 RepID=A0A8A6NIB4_9CAUD|nr:putative homing endonuclease [Enterobacter phage PF-CE2]